MPPAWPRVDLDERAIEIGCPVSRIPAIAATSSRRRRRACSRVYEFVAELRAEIAGHDAADDRILRRLQVSPLCEHVGQRRQRPLPAGIDAQQLRAVAAIVAGYQRKRAMRGVAAVTPRTRASSSLDPIRLSWIAFSMRGSSPVAAALYLQMAVEQSRRVVDHRPVTAAPASPS